ncbi:MAG: hypothetical protein AAFV37_06120 [Pseudomonadota bacterium]
MAEIVLDLGPVNKLDETAFSQAIEHLSKRFEDDHTSAGNPGDAPDLMIKTVSDAAGTLRRSVIFQKQDWAHAFIRFWEQECAA